LETTVSMLIADHPAPRQASAIVARIPTTPSPSIGAAAGERTGVAGAVVCHALAQAATPRRCSRAKPSRQPAASPSNARRRSSS
jgi:hypothetical protein